MKSLTKEENKKTDPKEKTEKAQERNVAQCCGKSSKVISGCHD